MKQHGRYFRPKPENLKGTPYDSNLELRLHEGILNAAQHHPKKFPYVWEHNYEPDFIVEAGGKVILVECKGYFQDRNDATKYIWVRSSLPENHELVLCFEVPGKPIHFQSVRADGTKMTHAQWAEKNGFRWFDEDSIGEILNA